MPGFLTILSFMIAIFSIAAAILLVVDRFTLPKAGSPEEKARAVAIRTDKARSRWQFFMFVMALTSLVFNALIGPSTKEFSTFWRVFYALFAAGYAINYILRQKGPAPSSFED